MNKNEHFRCLESMYAAAPINMFFQPEMEVREGEATIEINISEKHHHAAKAVHGSVYFKMLDDAAFFAANSLEKEMFVLTTSFTIYLTHPVVSGILRSEGRVVNHTKNQFIAESILYNVKGDEIARGSGIFVRSKLSLKDTKGYIANQ